MKEKVSIMPLATMYPKNVLIGSTTKIFVNVDAVRWYVNFLGM